MTTSWKCSLSSTYVLVSCRDSGICRVSSSKYISDGIWCQEKQLQSPDDVPHPAKLTRKVIRRNSQRKRTVRRHSCYNSMMTGEKLVFRIARAIGLISFSLRTALWRSRSISTVHQTDNICPLIECHTIAWCTDKLKEIYEDINSATISLVST